MVTVGIGSALDVVNKIPWHQTVQASVNFCIGSPFLFGCGDIGGSGSARATVILMYSFARLDWVLSHWAHFTVDRFICVYLCVFYVFLFHTA